MVMNYKDHMGGEIESQFIWSFGILDLLNLLQILQMLFQR